MFRAFPTLLRIGFAEAVAYRAELVIWGAHGHGAADLDVHLGSCR
jgi:ABC-type uncharacterized transport system permease subunit